MSTAGTPTDGTWRCTMPPRSRSAAHRRLACRPWYCIDQPLKHPYRAPVWLPGGHLQTLYSTLFIRVPPVAYRRERLELADGDFLDFDWVDSTGQAPVVVLFHGLEGSAESSYSRTLMARVQARGWRGVVAHFRGCPGEDNRLPRAYFAGDSADIECMLRHVKNRHPAAPIHAVGVSLGGKRTAEMAGGTGRGGGCAGRARSRRIGTTRPRRRRTRARPRFQPPGLHRALRCR